jgi:hypothetical protein
MIIRRGSAPSVPCQTVVRNLLSTAGRRRCLSYPFTCSSVAISTDLNWGEPDFIPVVASKAHSSPICRQNTRLHFPSIYQVAPVRKTNSRERHRRAKPRPRKNGRGNQVTKASLESMTCTEQRKTRRTAAQSDDAEVRAGNRQTWRVEEPRHRSARNNHPPARRRL